MPIPPPPPGFQIVSAPGGMPPLGRPVIRRAPEPKSPAFIPGSPGQVFDPTTGSARDIPGFKPKPDGSKTNYSTLSAAEVKKLGLPPGSYQRSSEGKVDKIADAPKADPAKDVNFRDPIDKILGVIDAAANAHRMTRKGGLASSPIGRVVGSYIPGTAPRDLSGYLDTIGGNTAFETLQQMRQDSPTGGAVGNVSDADMRLLRSTIASLDPGQGTQKFQKDLSTVLRSYQKVLYGLPGGKEAYRGWRVKWLGFDPDAKGKAPAKQGKVINFEDLPE